LKLGLAAQSHKKNILSWVLPREGSKIALGPAIVGPISVGPTPRRTHQFGQSLPDPRNLGQEKEVIPKGAWVWLWSRPKSLGSTVLPDPILLVLLLDPISWVLS